MQHIVALGARVLNFVIAGQVRSGASVLQTSIDLHPQATCYGDLLHPKEDVRRGLHTHHFGLANPAAVEWYRKGGWISPEQYLTTRVFDHPLHGEQAMGVKLLYPHLQAHDLWEYCRDRCLEGDFCLIHVRRNPLACFVSLKQAEQTGVWSQEISDRTRLETPHPVSINPHELSAFCAWHEAHATKIRAMCDDRLEIEYRELILNYPLVMAEVFDYLNLPPFPEVHPGVRRLKNRVLRERIFNFDVARRNVSPDIRRYFDADDLF